MGGTAARSTIGFAGEGDERVLYSLDAWVDVENYRYMEKRTGTSSSFVEFVLGAKVGSADRNFYFATRSKTNSGSAIFVWNSVTTCCFLPRPSFRI
mmetsp:Transcript_12310/g.29886  ORF Transcript_12310/g.29886 Transcript_12310/m.29886 type:complete len:96 (+) Transcript_12310:366-653(+)